MDQEFPEDRQKPRHGQRPDMVNGPTGQSIEEFWTKQDGMAESRRYEIASLPKD
jgi:hypothetical protein